ncbi:MAG: PQQ-binding-like beta-propeller repeat protein [Armatimonadetes bacterium]|nr:PQQ-binding-like beta-propeller repeat protein [Armatimonadota bacterium]
MRWPAQGHASSAISSQVDAPGQVRPGAGETAKEAELLAQGPPVSSHVPTAQVPASSLVPPDAAMRMFRGSPERNLSAVGPIPRRPKLLWRFRTRTKLEGPYERRGDPKFTPNFPWTGLGWTGQPCFADGKVYFGSSDSYVYCIDALRGRLLWYYPNHHSIKGSISVFGDRIYHGGRDNKIHCYTMSGKMVWETRTGNDMDSNPVVVGGRGYIGGEDRHLYCFDPGTGKILWRTPVEGSAESSPCVARGRVYIGTSRGYLHCCDARTGKKLWSFRTLGDTDSTPVYFAGRIYVGCATGNTGEKGHLWCLDAATGKRIWHLAFPRGIWATVAINPEKKRLYVGCNDGVFYALRTGNGGLVWKVRLADRIWSSAAVANGLVLVPCRNGRLWCLDEDTGQPVWVFNDGFDFDATPCVAGGLIIIGSQNGWVYCIGEAAPGEKLNTHWFADRFPVKKWPDRNPTGILTVPNPAPSPKTYNDTSAYITTNLLRPVYGPGYVRPRSQG